MTHGSDQVGGPKVKGPSVQVNETSKRSPGVQEVVTWTSTSYPELGTA